MGPKEGDSSSIISSVVLNLITEQQREMKENISHLYNLVGEVHTDVKVIKATTHGAPCTAINKLEKVLDNHFQWHEKEKEEKKKEEKEASKWKFDKFFQLFPQIATWAAAAVATIAAWKNHN